MGAGGDSQSLDRLVGRIRERLEIMTAGTDAAGSVTVFLDACRSAGGLATKAVESCRFSR